MLVGSKEWFEFKAKTEKKVQFMNKAEMLRKRFLLEFSPSRLEEMDGIDLLNRVFDNTSDSMMHILMFNHDYRWYFGASSEYPYMSIIYKGGDGLWTFFEHNKHIKMNKEEAVIKAEEIRDKLLECVSIISEIQPRSMEDYKALSKRLKAVDSIHNYVTILKYYQMVFPQFFPGMYADNTLHRCIQILGLKSVGKSSGKRIENMGVISIFSRNCGIHNTVFSSIYADEWDWVGTRETCPAHEENYASSMYTETVNQLFYDAETNEEDDTEKVARIEADLEKMCLDGKEREAIVNVRVNQGIFRKKLLMKYDKCCLCGVRDPNLLVASHIKPWIDCDAKEKLDKNNGFILCPNHDKLFDHGYISFEDDGSIIISDKLSKNDCIFTNINSDMKIEVNEGNKKYLAYHRDFIFVKKENGSDGRPEGTKTPEYLNGVIVDFKSRLNQESGKNRTEALVKGKIQVFTCDSCGEEFEVIDEHYPDFCPGCHLRITQWNNVDDNDQ